MFNLTQNQENENQFNVPFELALPQLRFLLYKSMPRYTYRNLHGNIALNAKNVNVY